MATVVAICGPPGSGKTTLLRGLCAMVPVAGVVHIDDHESFTKQSRQQVLHWISSGGDWNQFLFPEVESTLSRLREHHIPVDASDTNRNSGKTFVLFETLFGRAHSATAKYIDLQVWIDVPADISLARNLISIGEQISSDYEQSPATALKWMTDYCHHHLEFVSSLLRRQNNEVACHAEIVVDGELSPQAMVEQTAEKLLYGWER